MQITGIDRQRAGETAEALAELILAFSVRGLTEQQWVLIRDLQDALVSAERGIRCPPPTTLPTSSLASPK